MSDIVNLLAHGDDGWRRRAEEIKKFEKFWKKTGLLEGLNDTKGQMIRSNVAALLENQKNFLRKKFLVTEASAMASGDVTGFAAVAFPLVRRIFASLVANELVSVQPMSLPTGLIFYLDFNAGTDKTIGLAQDASIYGGGVLGSQLSGGVNLDETNLETGFYSLNLGYAAPTGSNTTGIVLGQAMSGVVGSNSSYSTALDAAVAYDPDLSGAFVVVATATLASFPQINERAFTSVNDVSTGVNAVSGTLVRRLTGVRSGSDSGATELVLVYSASAANAATDGATQLTFYNSVSQASTSKTYKFAIYDDFQNGSALGSVVGDPAWGLEFGSNTGENASIPEIDIFIDSISITAKTKKLKAKWTPELGQDLNAYHNLDAEVELTSILSEVISLEIDVEILNDLIKYANAGTYYWSRRPGRFVNRTTGEVIASAVQGDFTGNVSEWYQTLLETINDVSAQIQRRVLKGGATFLVCGPEVANILEFTQGFVATVTQDQEGAGDAGVLKIGSIKRKWDVYVTSYFPRNLILVGRKGSTALETGYVYAPYVPLQTTPVVPDPDTFVLNKGVMTRYGKQIVRSDFYGLCVVQDLFG